MTDEKSQPEAPKSFRMNSAVDQVRAGRDDVRTHLMAWKAVAGFVLLFGSLIALAVFLLKGLLK